MFDRVRTKAAVCDDTAGSQDHARHRPSRARPVLQAKLVVGSSNDPAEIAADRFADALVDTLRRRSALDPAPALSLASTRIARSTAAHSAAVGIEDGDLPAELGSRIRSSRGQPLDPSTRSTMEGATGVDLSAVPLPTLTSISRVERSKA